MNLKCVSGVCVRLTSESLPCFLHVQSCSAEPFHRLLRDCWRNFVVELSCREIHSVWSLSEKLVWCSLIYPKRKISVSVTEMTDDINTALLEQMILNDDKASTNDLARCFCHEWSHQSQVMDVVTSWWHHRLHDSKVLVSIHWCSKHYWWLLIEICFINWVVILWKQRQWTELCDNNEK